MFYLCWQLAKSDLMDYINEHLKGDLQNVLRAIGK